MTTSPDSDPARARRWELDDLRRTVTQVALQEQTLLSTDELAELSFAQVLLRSFVGFDLEASPVGQRRPEFLLHHRGDGRWASYRSPSVLLDWRYLTPAERRVNARPYEKNLLIGRSLDEFVQVLLAHAHEPTLATHVRWALDNTPGHAARAARTLLALAPTG